MGLSAHWCKKISWNQYRIFYDPNIKKYNGYMDYSYHMYNNETIYEGETVTPVTHLTENNYTRVGYVFTGWNTKQDGSGVSLPIRKRYTILVVQIGMIKVHGQIRIEELLLYTHSGEKVKVPL